MLRTGGNAVLIRFVEYHCSCSPVGLAVNNATGDFYDLSCSIMATQLAEEVAQLSGTLTSGKVPMHRSNTLADGSITDDGTATRLDYRNSSTAILKLHGVHTA